MGRHRQCTIFIIAYLLLLNCLCAQPTRSRRQKRGLLKQMMHIMWDPVRLIRYWYAYDVSKEIAKSWRKILPTILLLPVTQNNPFSHGFAKYVHPTIGVRDFDKKKNIKHASIPMASYHQASAINIKPIAIPQVIMHHALPSRYAYDPSLLQYYRSKEVDNNIHFKNKEVPLVIEENVHFEDNKGSDQFSHVKYIVEDSTSREEVPVSDVMFSVQDHSADNIESSSSQRVVSSDFNKMFFNRPANSKQKVMFLKSKGSDGVTKQSENGHETYIYSRPEQELHIVLHPISIDHTEHDSSKLPSKEQSIHIVKVGSNESYSINLDEFLKSSLENGAGTGILSEKEGKFIPKVSDETNAVLFPSNLHDRKFSAKTTNKVPDDNKAHVTWVSQKNTNQESDMQIDETTHKVISININSEQKPTFDKATSSTFSLNRHNINMKRLREDLKHGTPVLIPFNKNIYSSENDNDNPVLHTHSDGKNLNTDIKSAEDISGEHFKVPVVSTNPEVDSNSEWSSDKNSTQKIILFLKRKHA